MMPGQEYEKLITTPALIPISEEGEARSGEIFQTVIKSSERFICLI